MLRGMKNTNSSNPYLTREEDSFTETEHWKNLYSDNTLILIDEVQMLKNDTLSLESVKTLLKNIKNSNSKVIFMSGTPIDNHQQIYNYSYMLDINPEEFKEILKIHSDSMKPIKKNYNIKYYYCQHNTLTEELKEEFFVKNIRKENKNVKSKLMEIEFEKVPYITRLAVNYLQKSPNNKIVIGYYYDKTYLELEKTLAKYKPKIICGKTKTAKRSEYINGFQEHNAKNRLLIANADIINAGIDLADTHGDFPRICLLTPCYKDNQQLLYRFNHVSVKSDLELVYIISDFYEINIFNSNIKKQEVISEFSK
jgi:hypothetical protein